MASISSIDWLIVRYTYMDWLIDWFTYWLIDWFDLIDWFFHTYLDWFIDWLIDLSIDLSIDWLVGWLIDLLLKNMRKINKSSFLYVLLDRLWSVVKRSSERDPRTTRRPARRWTGPWWISMTFGIPWWIWRTLALSLSRYSPKWRKICGFSGAPVVDFFELFFSRCSEGVRCVPPISTGKATPTACSAWPISASRPKWTWKRSTPSGIANSPSPCGDIHAILEITVLDMDQDKKSDFLGRIAIPLLKIKNGERRWYALKDEKLIGRAKGSILLELSLNYNPIRAAIRTVNPQEARFDEVEPKFRRQVGFLVWLMDWFFSFQGPVIDWLIDWSSLIMWIIHLWLWLIAWLVILRSTVQSFDWLIDWLTYYGKDLQFEELFDWLIDWLSYWYPDLNLDDRIDWLIHCFDRFFIYSNFISKFLYFDRGTMWCSFFFFLVDCAEHDSDARHRTALPRHCSIHSKLLQLGVPTTLPRRVPPLHGQRVHFRNLDAARGPLGLPRQALHQAGAHSHHVCARSTRGRDLRARGGVPAGRGGRPGRGPEPGGARDRQVQQHRPAGASGARAAADDAERPGLRGGSLWAHVQHGALRRAVAQLLCHGGLCVRGDAAVLCAVARHPPGLGRPQIHGT